MLVLGLNAVVDLLKGMRMTDVAPAEMARAIGTGLLTFPVTPFDAANRFDETTYRSHCSWLLEHDVAALFAAGGTGEFISPTPAEIEHVAPFACRSPISPKRSKPNSPPS